MITAKNDNISDKDVLSKTIDSLSQPKKEKLLNYCKTLSEDKREISIDIIINRLRN